jgi:hypothetical protein
LLFGTAILVTPAEAVDEGVIDGGIRPQENMCDRHELDQDEMTNAEQRAWMTLGWRAENWGTSDPKAEPAQTAAAGIGASSLIETCKLCSVDPHGYLAKIVNGYPNCDIDDLLPWAYVRPEPPKAVA